MKKYLIVLICAMILHINVEAKDRNSKAQVTFVYPLGSNGENSINYSNNLSFNLLFGMNGGVEGFELGGVMNYNEGSVNGLQIAGVTNFNTAYSNGLLISGVLNYVEKESNGLQISTVNMNIGDFNGGQVSVFNYSNDFNGIQVGVFNVARNFTGFQLGVFNVSKKLKGVQLGVFNIAGSAKKGIPIGLFSMVRKGYYAMEFTANEVMYTNITYKMGVEQFYTIYKTGASLFDGDFIASYGLGFGTKMRVGKKDDFNIEATASQIVYDNDWGSDLNLLNRLDFNYVFNISRNLSFILGPSFNVYVTKLKVDGEFGTLDIPYTINEEEKQNSKVSIWIGANVGLSFRL